MENKTDAKVFYNNKKTELAYVHKLQSKTKKKTKIEFYVLNEIGSLIVLLHNSA